MTAAGQIPLLERERIAVLGIWVVAAFCLLSGRLWVLQVMRSGELRAEARERFLKEDVLPAKRGDIVDRDGRLLAANQTVYTLFGDRYHLRDFQFAAAGLAERDGVRAREVRRRYGRTELLEEYERYVAEVLAEPLGTSPHEVAAKLDEAGLGNVIFRRGIEEDHRRRLAKRLEEAGVRGVYFRKETKRFYPDDRVLAHVLGFVDHEGTGRAGVEKTMDAALRGVDGYRLSERDSQGRELVAFRRAERKPFEGLRVRLTVDLGLQEGVEASLDRAEETLDADSIAVILMDPRDGEVLALAVRPTFNLSTREGSRRNVAVSDQYEPGSTFKVITMGAAMDQRLVGPETKIPLDETARVGQVGSGDWLTATQVLARSSNPGIHAVGRELGPDRLFRAIRSFGFGEPTGIWLAAEAQGKVYVPEEWSEPSLSRISMGYQVAVTPLQMLNALAAVANGGSLLRPRIVQAVESTHGEVVYRSEREFRRRVLRGEAAQLLLRSLTRVTADGGTGAAASVEGFTVAGKTGTALWFDPEAGAYAEEEYVVSFVGALPAERPQLAGIVVIDRPGGPADQRTGGRLAAPLFAEIVRFAAGYLDLVPSAEIGEGESG